VVVLGCGKSSPLATEPAGSSAPIAGEPPIAHRSGPQEPYPMYGPYDSRATYCREKAECCCDPSVSALATPVKPIGPWKSVDFVRAADKPNGPWYLVVQTEKGWLGELYGFARFEGDVPSVKTPVIEIKDWLGLGTPQIVLHFEYSIASEGKLLSRETLSVTGVGPSGKPSYFTVPTVHVDESNGVRLDGSWTLEVMPGERGIEITTTSGTPSEYQVQLGHVPIEFR
jgi:hypothetical protein